MKLNTLRPADGRVIRRKRVGRGIGSGLGLGKTGGRGHKGQTSRSGGSIRPGFEGGQMPLQKRLPKYGFTSRIASVTSQVTLSELDSIDEKVINIEVLKSNGIIRNLTAKVKVFSSGQITKPVVLEGIAVSNGAREAIVSAGGTIKD